MCFNTKMSGEISQIRNPNGTTIYAVLEDECNGNAFVFFKTLFFSFG